MTTSGSGQDDDDGIRSEHYSVALIGSSGGGAATIGLGRGGPMELLTALHDELRRVRSCDDLDDDGAGAGGRQRRRRMTCVGISHAIFVSLVDGGGFDSIRDESDWRPPDDNDEDDQEDDDEDDMEGVACDGASRRRVVAELYAAGFDETVGTLRDSSHVDVDAVLHPNTIAPLRARLVARGSLLHINRLARRLDARLGRAIESSTETTMSETNTSSRIAAIISISSEPNVIHRASLRACRLVDLPVVGSGGTSLGRIASTYDLRVVGNSGGSVASTSATKARGWAMGLAEEWRATYHHRTARPEDGPIGSGAGAIREGGDGEDHDDIRDERVTSAAAVAAPRLRSILEAALPAFLFVSIALRLVDAWEGGDHDEACVPNYGENFTTTATTSTMMISTMDYALRSIVLGTTCCVLAASSISDGIAGGGGDPSTLLMSATIAGVLSSSSASQSVGGGSALAGLIAGAFVPHATAMIADACHRYHVTATMTSVLCGGGSGMIVGVVMHLSGVAQGLGMLTGALRCLLRWRKLILVSTPASSLVPFGLERIILSSMWRIQERWCRVVSSVPSLSALVYVSRVVENCAFDRPSEDLPIPMGVGFLFGFAFVYGSKIGWYHSVYLPLILLEMDGGGRRGGASLLGAIDECTLVMVCAGICAGNLVLPRTGKQDDGSLVRRNEIHGGGGEASLMWQALKTNIFCGDFIEAAYPSMERCRIINGAAYLAAGLSTEILLGRRVLGTAYLPLPLALWISSDCWGISIACFVAFSVSLFGTVASNFLSSW